MKRNPYKKIVLRKKHLDLIKKIIIMLNMRGTHKQKENN